MSAKDDSTDRVCSEFPWKADFDLACGRALASLRLGPSWALSPEQRESIEVLRGIMRLFNVVYLDLAYPQLKSDGVESWSEIYREEIRENRDEFLTMITRAINRI